MLDRTLRQPGPWFNIKMTSYQYRKSHCGDKTILRPSYLHNGIPYTGKTISLYWIRAQMSVSCQAVFCFRFFFIVSTFADHGITFKSSTRSHKVSPGLFSPDRAVNVHRDLVDLESEETTCRQHDLVVNPGPRVRHDDRLGTGDGGMTPLLLPIRGRGHQVLYKQWQQVDTQRHWNVVRVKWALFAMPSWILNFFLSLSYFSFRQWIRSGDYA